MLVQRGSQDQGLQPVSGDDMAATLKLAAQSSRNMTDLAAVLAQERQEEVPDSPYFGDARKRGDLFFLSDSEESKSWAIWRRMA